MAETDNWVHFRRGLKGDKSPSVITSCRKCRDEYPTQRLDKIFSIAGSPASLPKGLAKLIGRVEVFLDEKRTQTHFLPWLKVDITKTELRITGQGTHGKQSERQAVEYKGRPFAFYINPKLFRELVGKCDCCTISERTMKIERDQFQYVTSLVINDEEKKPD